MNAVFNTKQCGSVILEALIAFLVLGVGVIAMLYLQGNLMEGSSVSKAREEAVKLANDRMETLRNYIEKRQYLSALKNVQQDEIVNGVNAEFSVCYAGIPVIPENPTTDQVVQLLNVPVNLEVRVKWPGAEGATVICNVANPKDEEVTLETMLYFTKPEIASAINSQNNGKASDPSNFRLPSPWLTGVERAHESTEKFKDTTDADNSVISIDDDQRLIIIDDSGVVTFGNADIQIISYANSKTGNSNVEVVHDGVVKLTSFGGIVHKLEGEIILHHDADTELTQIVENFKLLASPPSYCVSPVCASGDCLIPSCLDVGDGSICNNEILTGEQLQYVSYVCYVPGDCTIKNSSGSHGAVCDALWASLPSCTSGDCADGFTVPDGKDSLNGGWYGRIGNFNLFLDHERDMVCTADTEIGGSTPNMTPSREYATHRWELDGTTQFIAGNEGINRSFQCPTGEGFGQVFIIAGIDNGPGECLAVSDEYQSLVLPSENILRVIGDSSAIPDTLDDSGNPQYPYAYPIPYPPLTDLVRPIIENNVVLSAFDDYCAPAP